MPIALAARPAKKHLGLGLPRVDFQRSLENIKFLTVSVIRALQMDVDRDWGMPFAKVLRRARQAIR